MRSMISASLLSFLKELKTTTEIGMRHKAWPGILENLERTYTPSSLEQVQTLADYYFCFAMLLIIPFYSFTCSWACPLQWGKPSSNGCPSIWACRGPRRAVSALGGPLNNLFKAWRVPSAIKAFAGQKGLPPLWICLEPQKMSNLKTVNSNQRAIIGWM